MKKLLFSLFMIATFFMNAQEFKDYYVVVKEGKSIEPVSKSTQSNGKLSLVFQVSQQNLQSFFNSKDVFLYDKAFPTATTPRLQRTYIVRLTGTDIINNLNNFPEIELVEELPQPILLFEPNDYSTTPNNPVFPCTPDASSQTQLDLIRAPLAWEIGQGENIVVGMTDTAFNPLHEDLVNKIIANYAGVSNDLYAHGTMVAGCIAAETNNGIGISAIGYKAKIISHSMGDQLMLQLSQMPNVKVVNGSWLNSCSYINTSQLVYDEIWNSGVLPVFAAGNASCGNANNYVYPASYDHVLSVTSVGHRDEYDTPYTWSSETNVCGSISRRDLHELYRRNSQTLITHQHNDKVDICAPGYLVVTTAGNNSYLDHVNGTSSAAPIVSGAAALVYSVNPNFTAQQVYDILKSTADDIYWMPENQQYIGKLGTGRLNAFRAVKKAQCMGIDPSQYTLDLMIKDSRQDVGQEPNEITPYMWESNDIWVRNQNGGKLNTVHQNPEFTEGVPNYIYVRVTNLGCKTSTGNETITLNWAKANTALSWPQNWDGSISINGKVLGGEVGVANIPILQPGQEAIVEIPWFVPNPNDYFGINTNPWHFCLIARVDAMDDPLSYPMTSNPNIMVRNNNNLAWKNLTVVNIEPGVTNNPIGGVIAVANLNDEPRLVNLELVKETKEGGKAIFDEAEINLKMDETLNNAWTRGGKLADEIKNTGDETKKVVTGNNVLFKNILFEPNEIGTLYVSFNFLTKELTEKDKYTYRVIQRDANTNEIMGGETFEIRKKSREIFSADAGGDKEIDKFESITLTAETLNEVATYNWYDEDNNLIYTGKDLTISPEITKKYKLEVISLDGFKDYDEIEVKVKPYSLQQLLPNPASENVSVYYDAQGSISAYVMLINSTNGTSDNYILNVNENVKNINVSSFPSGLYHLSFICDGVLIDSKNLIIE